MPNSEGSANRKAKLMQDIGLQHKKS